MNEQIKAGADIHAGDGGYSISTKEKYEAFVKLRNQSMNGKLKELMIEAGYAYPEGATRAHKLAELLVKECIDCARGAGLANDVAVRNKLGFNDGISEAVTHIKKHFGVEE